MDEQPISPGVVRTLDFSGTPEPDPEFDYDAAFAAGAISEDDVLPENDAEIFDLPLSNHVSAAKASLETPEPVVVLEAFAKSVGDFGLILTIPEAEDIFDALGDVLAGESVR